MDTFDCYLYLHSMIENHKSYVLAFEEWQLHGSGGMSKSNREIKKERTKTNQTKQH